jgi:predicted acylesterase/phospholipase RssA
VIKFLEEQNIRPSQIAGTSAGSIVERCMLGKTPEEILEFSNRYISLETFNLKSRINRLNPSSLIFILFLKMPH